MFICFLCGLLFLSGPLHVQMGVGNSSQLKVRAAAIAQRFSAGRTPLTCGRVPPTRSNSGSEVVVDLDMVHLQVAFELSEIDISDDETLPQRVGL